MSQDPNILLLVGQVVGSWNEIKALLSHWFSGWSDFTRLCVLPVECIDSVFSTNVSLTSCAVFSPVSFVAVVLLCFPFGSLVVTHLFVVLCALLSVLSFVTGSWLKVKEFIISLWKRSIPILVHCVRQCCGWDAVQIVYASADQRSLAACTREAHAEEIAIGDTRSFKHKLKATG